MPLCARGLGEFYPGRTCQVIKIIGHPDTTLPGIVTVVYNAGVHTICIIGIGSHPKNRVTKLVKQLPGSAIVGRINDTAPVIGSIQQVILQPGALHQDRDLGRGRAGLGQQALRGGHVVGGRLDRGVEAEDLGNHELGGRVAAPLDALAHHLGAVGGQGDGPPHALVGQRVAPTRAGDLGPHVESRLQAVSQSTVDVEPSSVGQLKLTCRVALVQNRHNVRPQERRLALPAVRVT